MKELKEAAENRDPHFIFTKRGGVLTETVYEQGTGATIARRTLDRVALSSLLESISSVLLSTPERAYPKYVPDKWDRRPDHIDGYIVPGYGIHQ